MTREGNRGASDTPPRGRGGRGYPLLASIALAVAALVLVLFILEIGVRWYAWSIGRGFWENPHDFVSPFFTSDGWPAPYHEGNTLVFKEGERVLRGKPTGEIRIVCLGGSTTLPSPDAEGRSYPRELERLLDARFPDYRIRVLNAGENAYSSAHSVVNLALRVLDAEPDIVTAYEAINDLSVNYFGAGAETDYANKYLTPFYLGFRHRVGVVAELERVSRLARFIDNRLVPFRTAGWDYDTRRDWHPGLKFFGRNQRSLVALAHAHGVDIVLGTQAARAARRTTAAFAAYNAVTRQVAAETGAALADVAAEVVNDGLFVDDVHNTSEGARVVARQWLDPVARLLEARLAKAQSAATGP
ncbi:MAG: hypothetical protein B6D46_05620 [Polyangiaceae bacterium UTPRO1]|nr:GDSL-type esterase/lipase family protein [Myxococcales bacterium]OQY67500.1 MAG: hypothetical protein B6D46_05620 [Polyangiaceae bacterium UTPRO1]